MTGHRPRLLFVSPRFLFPMDQGGKIRTGNVLRGLKGGCFHVTLASPAPVDHGGHASDIAAACDRFVSWPQRQARGTRRLLRLASRLPVAAAGDRAAIGHRLIQAELATLPDLVVVDFPHAEVLMPPRIDAASILFAHNVEAEIFERHAQQSWSPRRLVWASQARKMARLEGESLRRHNTVIAVSARDRAALVRRYGHADVEAIDTGVDLDYFAFTPAAVDPDPNGGTLVFAGTMSWAANVAGIHFLLDEVLPLLLRARPRLRATIVGRNPPASLSEKIARRGLDVCLTGFVDDIRPWVARADVYVIPLLVGSGTRIKAFEAMAMGRPVVSTGLGVEGLDVTDTIHFARGDDAEGFARAILALLDDATARRTMAAAARRLVEARFSWDRVARQFETICLRTLHERNARPSATPPAADAAA